MCCGGEVGPEPELLHGYGLALRDTGARASIKP